MIEIRENIDLKPFNTFGIHQTARYFCTVTQATQVTELLQTNKMANLPRLILGGGSNVLFTRDYDGLVIKVDLQGLQVIEEDADYVRVKVAAGLVWHQFVLYALAQDWGGVENLSLIPGLVGAAPIQNIGAYGVELKSVLHEVEGIDLDSGHGRTLNREECNLGYRSSIFKTDLKENFFISSVTLTLTKRNHQLNTTYGAIQSTLLHSNIHVPSIHSISDAVVKIRQEKLPDPSTHGNAGSFFKNPSVSTEHFSALKNIHPTIPHYPTDNQLIKIPAGWLIEQCGWKGKRIGQAGVHANQALVIINYGDASGEEIFALAMQIQASVKSKFDIELTPEVNIIG